jgi:hypothetical protein
MATIKAEVLASILDDSKNAKNIPGMANVYTPEEYNKKMAEQRAMGLLEGNDGYLHGDPKPGAIEFDKVTGNLRKINRNKAAMLDINIYTANRYLVDKKTHVEEGKDGKPGKEVVDSLDIVVVLGHAIVNGIQHMTEIPKSVKAYRFRKNGKNWDYVGAELVSDKQAYEMRNILNPYDVLSLMSKIRESDLTSNIAGDKLNDIA